MMVVLGLVVRVIGRDIRIGTCRFRPFPVELGDCFAISTNASFSDAELRSSRSGQRADIAPHIEIQLPDFLFV